jgi:hypothetical protein
MVKTDSCVPLPSEAGTAVDQSRHTVGLCGQGRAGAEPAQIARADILGRVHRPGGDPRGEAGFEPGCDVGHLLLHALRDHDFDHCGGSTGSDNFRAIKIPSTPPVLSDTFPKSGISDLRKVGVGQNRGGRFWETCGHFSAGSVDHRRARQRNNYFEQKKLKSFDFSF